VTSVTFDHGLEEDVALLDGTPVTGPFFDRVTRFLDLVRRRGDVSTRARVETRNTFPTAAGLASSASGFAALALSATRALGLDLSITDLSALARRGSGSACRSIPGGISVWQAGTRSDGADSVAHSIAQRGEWDLRVVIGVTEPGPKKVGSTEAMELTRATSPYYQAWIETSGKILEKAIAAVERRDFHELGRISEQSATAMHAVALAAEPAIVFWNGATVEALHRIRRLRDDGVMAYFTCDAGPQPKALCQPRDEEVVAGAMADLSGVHTVIRCRIGDGATLI
jgi:diphosphomevalonate decarboxylase